MLSRVTYPTTAEELFWFAIKARASVIWERGCSDDMPAFMNGPANGQRLMAIVPWIGKLT